MTATLDYPGRCRIVVNELEGQDQRGLIAAWRSRHYDSAATAALAWEAEALTPLDSAATAALSGSSGGGNNTVKHSNLSTAWTPVLSTQASGGGAHMTHVGSYRVYARVYSPDGSAVSLRLLWDVGDLALPVENGPWTFPGASQFYVADLGEVRLDQVLLGSHRWQGVIQAKGTVGGEDVNIDRLWLVPIDESMAKMRASLSADIGLASYSARDEFNQSAGNLDTKTLPVGGTWTTSGHTTDLAVEASGHTVQRSVMTDPGLPGRDARAGTTVLTDSVAQVDFKISADSSLVSSYLFLRAPTVPDPTSQLTLEAAWDSGVISWRLLDGSSDLFPSGGFINTPAVAGVWYTMRLMALANGVWAAWFFAQDASPGEPLGTGRSTNLATGGSRASGRVGFGDAGIGSGASVTRSYDNFGAWVPTSDAVVFASQSAELRTEGVFREDSAGASSGPVSSEGDLMRVPPPGLEARSAQLFVKASRGDLDQLPDSASGDGLSVQVFYRPSWLFVPGS